MAEPNNHWLTTTLAERTLPLEVRSVFDLRSSKPASAIARIAAHDGFSGQQIERFAAREGRGREVLIYCAERAYRHVRSWRTRGFTGTLYFPLRSEDLADRTLATSFDVIAKSQSIDASALTIVVPFKDYVSRRSDFSSAVSRIGKVGCGIAMALNTAEAVRFGPLGDHPFTSLILGGKDAWRRLRTVGPGKLGALGSWLGWAEAQGLMRTAAGIVSAQEEETAKLYGFSCAEGPHYGEFTPARSFMVTETEEPLVAALPVPPSPRELREGLPPKPVIGLRTA